MSSVYKEIFDNTHGYIGLLEPDGTVVKANEAALAFGGVTQEDVVGKLFWDTCWFQHAETTKHQVRRAVESAADGMFWRQELEVQGVEETRIIDFSIRPITDDDGTVTRLIPEGRDIGARNSSNSSIRSPHASPVGGDQELLIGYTKDDTERRSDALVKAFLSLGIDINEKDQPIQNYIDIDILDNYDWGSQAILSLTVRIWTYLVKVTPETVRIYTNQEPE